MLHPPPHRIISTDTQHPASHPRDLPGDPLCSTLAPRPAHATIVEYDEYELQELLSEGAFFLDAGFEALSSAETSTLLEISMRR
jgi:hypothetical protein